MAGYQGPSFYINKNGIGVEPQFIPGAFAFFILLRFQFSTIGAPDTDVTILPQL